MAASSVNAKGGFDDGKYIVTLRDKPAATYDGGVKSFAATKATKNGRFSARSKKVVSYTDYLSSTQEDLASDIGVKVVSSYTLALNGFSGTFTGAQALKAAQDPRVASVVKDELLHMTADSQSSLDYLKIIGANGLWSKLGGAAGAGKGVVVGMLDSGIAAGNPSFAGDKLGTTPGADPYLDGNVIKFNKADGGQFTGSCQTGVQFVADDCSTKVIGARYFVENFGIDAIKTEAQGEYASPRDGAGHGSHTASTAAGNSDVPASIKGQALGTISGVAPAAKLAIYKVCWSSDAGDGCALSDSVAAINQAVEDGVDVLNYSIGGGGAFTTVSITDAAFLGAASAGVFVAASAGNDGPTAETADNAAPWITTVAATTIPSRAATVSLGNGEHYLGGSITIPDAGITAPFVSARQVQKDPTVQPGLCAADSLDESKVAGKIVFCERGIVDRVAKSAEVKRAGGVGMVLGNEVDNSIDLDVHSLPTVHINFQNFAAVKAYAETAGATVTLTAGNPQNLEGPPNPQVAGFSSRGPVLGDGGDILKPDIAAPGVGILADGPNAAGEPGTFQYLSGTSMASPHIAGLAALYLAQKPLASPAEIKSAMMTSSSNTVDAQGKPVEDPFAQGSGQVEPNKYFHPGFLFLNGPVDWEGYVQSLGDGSWGVPNVDPVELNLPSISIGQLPGVKTVTRTATATAPGTFHAQPVSMPGVEVTVEPQTLTFAKEGDTATYTVTFRTVDSSTGALNKFTTGNLRWVSDADQDGVITQVTTPLAARPVNIGVPADVAVTGAPLSGSVPITVQGGANVSLPLTSAGLNRGTVVRGAGTKGGHDSYVFTVPEGSTLQRFDLNGDNPDDDLDLHVYGLLSGGNGPDLYDAQTGGAHERIDATSNWSQYIVDVTFEHGDDDFRYTLSMFGMAPATQTGDFATSTPSLEVTRGAPSTFSTSWSGLAAGATYLGRVTYGETGDVPKTTTVSVSTAPDGTPVATGPLTFTTDVTHVLPGRFVTAVGSGLVPGEAWSIALDDSTTPVRGFADDSGSVSRYIAIPDDTTLGLHQLTLTTATGAVKKVSITVAEIVANTVNAHTGHDVTGVPVASVEGNFTGKGTIRLAIQSVDGKKTFVDERHDVESDQWYGSISQSTEEAKLPVGDFVGKAWVVNTDGSMGQEVSTSFTLEQGLPAGVTFTPSVTRADTLTATVQNNSDQEIRPELRLKLCSGPIIYTQLRGIVNTASSDTLDLRGVTKVEALLEGKLLATYENNAPSRCIGNPDMHQGFWVTLSDQKITSTPGKPITLTISNRYAAESYGFDFKAGYGADFNSPPFHFEEVPTDVVHGGPGPVVERSTQMDADKAVWAKAVFEITWPYVGKSVRWDIISATSLADLAPVASGAPGATPPPTDPPGSTPVASGATAPTPPHTEPQGSGLAVTGYEAGGLLAGGAILILLGAVLLIVRARHRRMS